MSKKGGKGKGKGKGGMFLVSLSLRGCWLGVRGKDPTTGA